MKMASESGALLDNLPRRKIKALLLDITIVNTCDNCNLENAARHARENLADAAEGEIK